MKSKFTKKFYYNKTSILKLIYLYNYLNETSFLDELSLRLIQKEFSSSQKEINVLSYVYSCLNPNLIKTKHPFGFVRTFEDRLIFYFKSDCDFDEFFEFFFNLESNYQIKWFSIECFTRDVKIFEAFSKTSLLRTFEEKVVTSNNKKNLNKLAKFKEINLDNEDKTFLFFLKQYDSKSLKLIVYFCNQTI